MNLSGAPDLALILFAPWFLILCALYWIYPRQPRNARRRLFDIVALLVALGAFMATLHWSHGYADRQYGAMWPQILATSVGYGVFLLVLVAAVFVRRAWLGVSSVARGRPAAPSGSARLRRRWRRGGRT